MVDVKGIRIDPGELKIAFLAVRAHADRSAYGHLISDAMCKEVATEVVIAIENYRSGEVI